jgi:hypothetical protein
LEQFCCRFGNADCLSLAILVCCLKCFVLINQIPVQVRLRFRPLLQEDRPLVGLGRSFDLGVVVRPLLESCQQWKNLKYTKWNDRISHSK